ncbi:MAG: hypothetical protein P8N91_06205 [Flavobacteriaceae bacterium]|nr:hypothetical protein [Flavobacteriaceae bacterium]
MFFFAICILNAQKVDSLFNTRSFLKKNVHLGYDADNTPVVISRNKYIELIKPNFHEQIQNTFTPVKYEFDFSSSYSVNVDSNLYVISRDGSTVYAYDKKSGLKKLNNPTTTKSYFKSSIFSYGGSIYRLGGYGYFHHKSQLFKFDFVNRKWVLIKNILEDNHGFINPHTVIVDNKVHIISRHTANNFNNKRLKSKYIYTVNLDDYNTDRYEFDYIEYAPFIFNNSFSVNNYFKVKNGIGFINNQNNRKAVIFDLKKKTSTLVELKSPIATFCEIIHYNNKLFYFSDDHTSSSLTVAGKEKIRINVSKIDRIHKEKSFEGTNYTNGVGLLSVAFSIFLIIYIKRKRSPFLLEKKSIKKGEKFIKLDIDEKFFVECLINDIRVENQTLISYFDKDGKSYDLNVKRKNTMISKLSLKFYSQFKKELFKKAPSSIDKRQGVYVLKQKLILANKKS